MKIIAFFLPLFLSMGCIKSLPKNKILNGSQSDSLSGSDKGELYRIPEDKMEDEGTKKVAQQLIERRTQWLLDQSANPRPDKKDYTSLKDPDEWGIEVADPTVMIFRKDPTAILQSGEVLNRYQSGTSGGLDLTNQRPLLETGIVGIEFDMGFLSAENDSKVAKLYKELMPKFGYFGFTIPSLEDADGKNAPKHLLVPGFDSGTGRAADAQYGKYGFMLRKETLARTIYFPGNSLRAFVKNTPLKLKYQPGWVDGFFLPVLASFFRVPFAALQYGDDPHEGIVYGRIDLADVEALLIPAAEFDTQSKVRQLAASKNVKVMSYTEEGNELYFNVKKD